MNLMRGATKGELAMVVNVQARISRNDIEDYITEDELWQNYIPFEESRDGLKRSFAVESQGFYKFRENCGGFNLIVEVFNEDCENVNDYVLTLEELQQSVYNELLRLKRKHCGFWADFVNFCNNYKQVSVLVQK